MKPINKSIEGFDNLLLDSDIELLKIWFESASSEDLAIAYNKLAIYIFHICGEQDDIGFFYTKFENFNSIIHQAIELLIQRYLMQGELLSRQQ